MTAILTASFFSEHVHSLFTLKADSASWPAELIELSVRNSCAKGPQGKYYEQFSLIFLVSDPEHPVLPQKIYSFDHPILNDFTLFIVPIRKDEKGVYYQAVFNRLLEENEYQNV